MDHVVKAIDRLLNTNTNTNANTNEKNSIILSDEHLLVALALLSKSKSKSKSSVITCANQEASSSSQYASLASVLKNYKQGILLQFMKRLILTHNNQIKKIERQLKKSSNEEDEDNKDYQSYANLAVYVLLAANADNLISENDECLCCLPLLYLIVEATWLRLIRLKQLRLLKLNSNSEQNSYIMLIVGILQYILSSNDREEVFQRLSAGGMMMTPNANNNENGRQINNATGSDDVKNVSFLSQLLELACVVPSQLLGITLRLMSRIWGLEAVRAFIGRDIDKFRGLMYCGLRYNNDSNEDANTSWVGKRDNEEFCLERGEALTLMAHVFEDRTFYEYDGDNNLVNKFWSTDAQKWFRLACGEITILLGRAITILENNDIEIDISTPAPKQVCRIIVKWVELCERIFLSTLAYLGKIASAFENENGNEKVDVDWESLLALRQPMDGAINSIMQFMSSSVNYKNGIDVDYVYQMQCDISVSCIRCFGAWLAESYDGCDDDIAIDENNAFFIEERLLPLKAATSAAQYCQWAMINCNATPFRDISYTHDEMFLSIIPGIVSISAIHSSSNLCLHSSTLSPNMKTHLIDLFVSILGYLQQLVEGAKLESFWFEHDSLLQWLNILFDEFDFDKINLCTCDHCSKIGQFSSLKTNLFP